MRWLDAASEIPLVKTIVDMTDTVSMFAVQPFRFCDWIWNLSEDTVWVIRDKITGAVWI